MRSSLSDDLDRKCFFETLAQVLTFLAGAEIDPASLRASLRASLTIGILSFLLPFVFVWLFAQFVLGWPLHQAQIAGIALSTTSVAVVYAVMIEGGLGQTPLGKTILAACFIGLDRAARIRLRVLARLRGFEVGLAAQQDPRADQVWMQSVLTGTAKMPQLVSDLKQGLPEGEVERLLECMNNGVLRYRRRAFAFLCFKRGIEPASIREFLSAGPEYVIRLAHRYEQSGLGSIIKCPRKWPRKYDQPLYQNAVLAMLHSPPSAHEINRATWRIDDIKRVMTQQGLALCTSAIRRIIRDGGYTVRKAKLVLTSNDPDY